MKTLTISIIAFLIFHMAFGQQEQYQSTMLENIESLKKAEKTIDFQNLANNFDRIVSVEKKEWLPSYYSAYCYIMISFRTKEGEKIDQMLDIAQKQLDRSIEINATESELLVLQALLYQARISVDFMGRGMKYAAKAQEALAKAKALDLENPRIYYLMGRNLYSTPPFAGGGPDKAHPYFKEAKEKYNSFTLVNELYPDWGMKENEGMLKRSSEQIKNN